VPQSLHAKGIDLAHEGHLGLVKSKKVWFPKTDAMMAERREVLPAFHAKPTPSLRPEPLHMSETPDYVWQE